MEVIDKEAHLWGEDGGGPLQRREGAVSCLYIYRIDV